LSELPDVEVLNVTPFVVAGSAGGLTKFGTLFLFLYPIADGLLALSDLIGDGLLGPAIKPQIPDLGLLLITLINLPARRRA
jgi:hypothetical protein